MISAAAASFLDDPQVLIDQFSYRHKTAGELARGGQGVVFRTTDSDLAIKQPLIPGTDQVDDSPQLAKRYRQVWQLPLPAGISISLPLAVLKNQNGYVMKLLNSMHPFAKLELTGPEFRRLKQIIQTDPNSVPGWLTGGQVLPEWSESLAQILPYWHYANTGSTKLRLQLLAKCAAILARLHAAGLVYCDVSYNNCFYGQAEGLQVWLIDADNLRHEKLKPGSSFYTPGLGAPEIMQGADSSRPRSDIWAFAVMAFEMLTLTHPFIGRMVSESQAESDDWAASVGTAGTAANLGDLRDQAFAGWLPFIDDADDDRNRTDAGLPRSVVLTPSLARLFAETFGPGRIAGGWHRRPAMVYWALELARAGDLFLDCPDCHMSYIYQHQQCPYCDKARPAFVLATTPRWQKVIQKPHNNKAEVALPHRMFYPFSLEHFDDGAYTAEVDFGNSNPVGPARGTKPIPADLEFDVFLKAVPK